ncbi:MAG: hypothetical protein Q4C56_07080 [Peptococcaceae bacterium]|nr:hypothetical protein [Peptococcaceae bacterium]
MDDFKNIYLILQPYYKAMDNDKWEPVEIPTPEELGISAARRSALLRIIAMEKFVYKGLLTLKGLEFMYEYEKNQRIE